ncbi:MAG: hypothetical protein WBD11_09130 [Xanthobacteraceae bacterium]
MIAFTDQQLALVMAAARTLPVETRAEFLELIAAQLKIFVTLMCATIHRG